MGWPFSRRLTKPRFAGELAVASLLVGLPPSASAEPLTYDPPIRHGDLHPSIRESSGLAASRITPGVFWTHNDSGDGPVLFRVSAGGPEAQPFLVGGANARDWEDMASFTLDGVPYLLVADVGDNGRNRPWVVLYLVREPQADADPTQPLRVVREIRLTYADGPRDCEAVAVAPTTREVVLISKEVNAKAQFFGPAGVYVLKLPDPLSEPDGGTAGPDAAPDQPLTLERAASLPATMPPAMDISPDGRYVVLGTYGDALLFERTPDQSWAEVLRQNPQRVFLPPRKQGEAICFGADGRSLFVTSEKRGQPLWEVPAVAQPVD